jgi:hypothetical protein
MWEMMNGLIADRLLGGHFICFRFSMIFLPPEMTSARTNILLGHGHSSDRCRNRILISICYVVSGLLFRALGAPATCSLSVLLHAEVRSGSRSRNCSPHLGSGYMTGPLIH